MTFSDKLLTATQRSNSLLCVGLDSDIAKLPVGVDQITFNRAIIDATHDLVCAYKPNTAFYEAQGADGLRVLKETCDYIRSIAPDVLIILDAKRADIGNTNNGYVQFAYDYLKADAITLHPYLGSEALAPFLERSDKGAIILCRTSNAGAGEFQDQIVGEKKLYLVVAETIARSWNKHKNCMLVVGATYPKEAAQIRDVVGDDIWFLIPGVGAQGGDVAAVVAVARNRSGEGFIISSSRDIIFADTSASNFAAAARLQAQKLRDSINTHRKDK